jgi:hypothetical protein
MALGPVTAKEKRLGLAAVIRKVMGSVSERKN